VRRSWDEVNAGRLQVLGCQVCAASPPWEAAHVIGRSRDPRSGRVRLDDIAFLCKPCHRAYDAHTLDLYPHLSPAQLRAAVSAAGGPGMALRRLSGPLWRNQGTPTIGLTIDNRLKELHDLGLGS
jgi:hypothetical protein